MTTPRATIAATLVVVALTFVIVLVVPRLSGFEPLLESILTASATSSVAGVAFYAILKRYPTKEKRIVKTQASQSDLLDSPGKQKVRVKHEEELGRIAEMVGRPLLRPNDGEEDQAYDVVIDGGVVYYFKDKEGKAPDSPTQR